MGSQPGKDPDRHFRVGASFFVYGLRTCPQYNGREVMVVGHNGDRLEVKTSFGSPRTLGVKRANLRRAPRCPCRRAFKRSHPHPRMIDPDCGCSTIWATDTDRIKKDCRWTTTLCCGCRVHRRVRSLSLFCSSLCARQEEEHWHPLQLH